MNIVAKAILHYQSKGKSVIGSRVTYHVLDNIIESGVVTNYNAMGVLAILTDGGETKHFHTEKENKNLVQMTLVESNEPTIELIWILLGEVTNHKHENEIALCVNKVHIMSFYGDFNSFTDSKEGIWMNSEFLLLGDVKKSTTDPKTFMNNYKSKQYADYHKRGIC